MKAVTRQSKDVSAGSSKQGKVAVVTGAAQGLGRAFARRLAAEHATVLALDRNPAPDLAQELRESGGAGSEFHQVDVSDAQQVESFAQAALAKHSHCDILVNNAGIALLQPLLDISLEDWRRVMSINVESVFLLCKAFAPAMRAQRYGRIVSISSNTVGLVVENMAHYIASKAAMVGFTRAIATELGPHGITANCIAPGLTRTERTIQAFPGDEVFQENAQAQAIKRPGVPEDLVGAVSFLTSDDSAFITGQTLIVDGGLLRTQ